MITNNNVLSNIDSHFILFSIFLTVILLFLADTFFKMAVGEVEISLAKVLIDFSSVIGFGGLIAFLLIGASAVIGDSDPTSSLLGISSATSELELADWCVMFVPAIVFDFEIELEVTETKKFSSSKTTKINLWDQPQKSCILFNTQQN